MNVTIDAKTALLAYTLQHPEISGRGLGPATEIYQYEDYILATYILLFGKSQLKLTREALEPAMKANADKWVNPRSILSRTFPQSKDLLNYIQHIRPDVQLVNMQEYAHALTEMVLARYDELIEVQPNIDETDLPAIYQSIKLFLQKEGTLNINQNIYNLCSGVTEYLYLGNVKYDADGANLYAEAAFSDLKQRVNAVGKVEDYSSKITRHQIEGGIFLDEVFQYNFGKDIILNPMYGETTYISADPKTGKTKFGTGEVTYSAMANMVNVLYLSTEMSGIDMQCLLIVKHIYATTGKRINAKSVKTVLNLIGCQRKGVLTKAQKTLLALTPAALVETISIAEYELFHSGQFGKFEVVYAGDPDDPLVHLFAVENLLEGIRSLQDSLLPEDRYGVIVLDHAGGFHSDTGLAEHLMFNEIYKSAPFIAKYKIPSHVFVFNHTATDDSSSIRKSQEKKDDNALFGKKVRAYGSNSAGKNAYNDYSFIRDPQQERDGLMTLHVNYVRNQGIAQDFGTTDFLFVSELDVNNFYLKGFENPPYRYKKYRSYKTEGPLEGVEE